MARGDGRVERGQKLATAFSARAWNRAQDAADIVLGDRARFGAGQEAAWPRASNLIAVANNGPAEIPWLGVLGIAGVAISPVGGTLEGSGEADSRARNFAERPVLAGTVPTVAAHADAFAIAMEPIPIGRTGLVAIGGAFACKVHVTDASHRFAGVKDGDVTQLQSARCGPVQLLWKEPGVGECKWACGVM
jgi:hypothetical protein